PVGVWFRYWLVEVLEAGRVWVCLVVDGDCDAGRVEHLVGVSWCAGDNPFVTGFVPSSAGHGFEPGSEEFPGCGVGGLVVAGDPYFWVGVGAGEERFATV